jgi:hypothetical protein
MATVDAMVESKGGGSEAFHDGKVVNRGQLPYISQSLLMLVRVVSGRII